MPWAVILPLSTNSGLPWKMDSGKSSPRGILIPNSRSRRKTMSRKSIDSAPRSPWRVAVGWTSSASTPNACIRAPATRASISLEVGMVSSFLGKVRLKHGKPASCLFEFTDRLGQDCLSTVADDGPLGTGGPERFEESVHLVTAHDQRGLDSQDLRIGAGDLRVDRVFPQQV